MSKRCVRNDFETSVACLGRVLVCAVVVPYGLDPYQGLETGCTLRPEGEHLRRVGKWRFAVAKKNDNLEFGCRLYP